VKIELCSFESSKHLLLLAWAKLSGEQVSLTLPYVVFFILSELKALILFLVVISVSKNQA